MDSRIGRLYADYMRLLRLSEVTPSIRLVNCVGMPPTQYDIFYDVIGLCETADGVAKHMGFTARIRLPRRYPTEAPICQMLRPSFHPNIAPHAICIVDHWSAAESLPEMVIRIGEIISYQSYNVKSPLNGEAAKWAHEHIEMFPIDWTDLGSAYRANELALSEADVERFAYEFERRLATPEAASDRDPSSAISQPSHTRDTW